MLSGIDFSTSVQMEVMLATKYLNRFSQVLGRNKSISQQNPTSNNYGSFMCCGKFPFKRKLIIYFYKSKLESIIYKITTSFWNIFIFLNNSSIGDLVGFVYVHVLLCVSVCIHTCIFFIHSCGSNDLKGQSTFKKILSLSLSLVSNYPCILVWMAGQ